MKCKHAIWHYYGTVCDIKNESCPYILKDHPDMIGHCFDFEEKIAEEEENKGVVR